MPGRPQRFLHVLVTVAAVWPAGAARAQQPEDADPDDRNAVSLFGGVLTADHWGRALDPWAVEFRDSNILGVALSRRLSPPGRALSFEIEGQAVRHFGEQDHWEFNLPLVGRWDRFPWDDTVDTSFAFGLGPSYASEVPPVEVERSGTSQRWHAYWFAELEFGPPRSAWSGLLRLHHRSDAFGLIPDGSASNVLAIGLRRRF